MVGSQTMIRERILIVSLAVDAEETHVELTLFQAIVYGIVQGIGEFLPISSSGHLLLVPLFMNWQDPGLSFGVALHLGTLFAVLLFFWQDLLRFVLAGVGLGRGEPQDKKLFWLLVLATIPGAIIGFLFEDLAETVFRSPLIVAAALIIMGILLYAADRLKPESTPLYNVSLFQALFIGFAQALAIVPGVSRSGATMTAARFLGLQREAAARFSFLLSTPIIFGAGLLQVPKLDPTFVTSPAFWVGLLTAAITGYASIGFLLRYLSTHNFAAFAVYRLILGLLILLFF